MLSVPVVLGTRSYPIHIGAGLLADGALLRPHIAGRQVMVVTNETVAPLYLERLLRALGSYTVFTYVLPDGEEYKTLDRLNAVFDALLAAPCERSVTLIALGGGVVGDLTGFAASCYQRGVAYIQIPTTLLAQVDSSVGGKTAVNHRLGKNMIGAFHQPRCVLADTSTLDSLPQRELVAGLAEVIKYGLIQDRQFFDWLECHIDALLARDTAHLAHAIERCCRDKAAVVAADECEAGVRAILNLGHTFGHAIEVGLGYGEWLHGEAVAVGMALAADLSWRRGRLSRPDVARVAALLDRAGLPVRWPAQLGVEELLAHMAVDKKALDGQIRLVLLASIGAAETVADCPAALLRESLVALHGGRC